MGGIDAFLSSLKTVGGIHCDTFYDVVAHMLRYFNNKARAVVINFNGVVELRKMTFLKLYIDDRTDNLNNFTYIAHEFVFLLIYLRNL